MNSNMLLSNTCACLKQNKLTIGYIGGSITYGLSAKHGISKDGNKIENGGDARLSYVNRTTAWFKESFPQAYIDFVNAGIAMQYRYRKLVDILVVLIGKKIFLLRNESDALWTAWLMAE